MTPSIIITPVEYATFRQAFDETVSPAVVYLATVTTGYFAAIAQKDLAYSCIIQAPADITDFEAVIKPGATGFSDMELLLEELQRLVIAFVPSTPTGNVNITQYGSVATTLGQKTMANSIPVTWASDQTGGGGGGGGGTAATDKSSFVEATTQFTPVGGEFKDAGVDLTDGKAGIFRSTAKRALHVNLRDASAVEIGTGAAPIRIDPTGTTPQPVTQSGTWAVLGTKTNNAAAPLATNFGALTALANAAAPSWTEGNLVLLSVDLTGALRTTASFTPSGTQDVNLIKIDGTAALTGNGVTGAGSQRVTIASDNTAFTVNAAQSGSWSVSVSGSVAVTGPLTDAQLRATPVPVSGTVAATQSGTWNIGTVTTVTTVATLTSITNVVHVDDNAGSLTVDGTVTANVGTTGGLALDATLTGGTQKAIVRGGAKGATVAADVTSTAEGADHQSIDVQIYHGAAAIDPTAIRTLTNADVVSAEVTKWIGSTAPTVGQKTMANSLPIAIASDQTAFPVSQSGTWNIGTVTTVTAVTAITNALPAGSNVIGHVIADTGSTTAVTGTVTVAGVVSTKTALTTSSPTAASVGVASASAVASNANRKGLVLTNTSSTNISFGLGAAAVLNSGITLTPGGVWEMDEYTFTTGTINAIAGAAASNLAIQEFTT